jgi:hypothetical protein
VTAVPVQRPELVVLPGGGVAQHDIIWELSARMSREVHVLYESPLSKADYRQQTERLRAHLCKYFSSGNCTSQALNVSVLGAGDDGAKRLKVRWALPGGGKSGGLRIAASVWCERQKVRLHAMFRRSTDPSHSEFSCAFDE